MTKTSHLAKSAAALAALVIAGSASAQQAEGTFVPEFGMGYLHGATVERSNFDPGGDASYSFNAAFGWEHPSGLGVRALFLFDGNPVRGLWEDPSGIKAFDRFYGLQATGTLPVGEKFSLKAGAGIGRTRLNVSPDTSGSDLTDGVLSLGMQWRIARHYAMELRVDHLTKSQVTSTNLQFQFPF